MMGKKSVVLDCTILEIDYIEKKREQDKGDSISGTGNKRRACSGYRN